MARVVKKDPPEEKKFDILQALANVYNWKENLAENINPRAYGFYADDDAPGADNPILGNEAIQRLYNAIVLDRKEPIREKEEERIELLYDPSNPDYSSDQAVEAERQDLLNLMLGRGQKYGSIEPAIYKPTDAKDPDAEYVRSRVTEQMIKNELMNPYVPPSLRGGRGYKSDEDGVFIGEGKDIPDLFIKRGVYGDVLGNYTLDKGVDDKGHYISYYDIWDVNPLSRLDKYSNTTIMSRGLDEAIQSAAGIKPSEVYGRIYYDPETGQPIDEKKYGGTVRPLKKYKVLK